MAGDNAAVTTSLREVLVAETLKKGTRVTGAERDKLAEQLKKRYDSGESIRALASYLGHADPGFTLRVYTHLMPASEERTRRALDRVLD